VVKHGIVLTVSRILSKPHPALSKGKGLNISSLTNCARHFASTTSLERIKKKYANQKSSPRERI
jgi:hypothetical protein